MELSQAYATRIKQLMKENRVNLYKLSNERRSAPHDLCALIMQDQGSPK